MFGRDPDEAELAAGIAYVTQEPMRTYEERRAERDKKAAAADATGTTPAPAEAAKDAAPMQMGMGMMAGVLPGAGAVEEQKKLLPVTALGRYMKVLLSSNEFLFLQ